MSNLIRHGYKVLIRHFSFQSLGSGKMPLWRAERCTAGCVDMYQYGTCKLCLVIRLSEVFFALYFRLVCRSGYVLPLFNRFRHGYKLAVRQFFGDRCRRTGSWLSTNGFAASVRDYGFGGAKIRSSNRSSPAPWCRLFIRNFKLGAKQKHYFFETLLTAAWSISLLAFCHSSAPCDI